MWLSLVRALHWGCRGRKFESCHPDLKSKQLVALIRGELFLFDLQRFTLFLWRLHPVQTSVRITSYLSLIVRKLLFGHH